MKITDIYSKTLGLESHSINGCEDAISFIISGGKLVSYPRMLEYFVYDLEESIKDDATANGLYELLVNDERDFSFYIYSDSYFLKLLPEYFVNGNYKKIRLSFVTNVFEIDFTPFSSFDDYLKTLARKRRYKFKKATENMLSNFSVCNELSDFDAFSNMHIAQWGGRNDPSILLNRKWYEFYRKGFSEGKFILHKFVDDFDNPVAYHLGFEKMGVFHYLMPTYTRSSTIDSPGFSLLACLIVNCYESNAFHKFSLGSGEYDYKKWLSNTSSTLLNVRVEKSKISYLLTELKRIIKSNLKRKLKHLR